MHDDSTTTVIVWLVCMGIAALISTLITGWSVYTLCYLDSSSWLNRTCRNLTIITMCCLTSTIIFDVTKLTNKYFGTEDSWVDFWAASISDTVYFAGNITFYILLLLRIHVPFKLNPAVFSSLACIIFIFAVASITYIGSWTLPYLLHHGNYDENALEVQIFEISAIILSIDDFILNSIILVIFIRKMRQTISNLDSVASVEIESKVNLISNIVTKHFVLFGMVIPSNQFFVLNELYHYYTNENWNTSYWIRTFSMRAFECILNSIVLWLVLRINYNKYIICCKSCHLCAARCCFKKDLYVSSVDNPYLQLQENKN